MHVFLDTEKKGSLGKNLKKKKATWVFSPKNFQLRRKIRDLLLLSILVQK